MLTGLLNTLLIFSSVVLIFLVLIQRGKGGGLAGAFGGMGGSSAFGTRAGDVFTKVTIWVAVVWIAISMLLVLIVNQGHTSAWGPEATGPAQKSAPTGKTGKTTRGGTAPGAPGTGKTPEVEPAPPGQAPPPAKGKAAAQPINPGDPLPPLPPPVPARKTP